MYLPEALLALVVAYITDGHAGKRALERFFLRYEKGDMHAQLVVFNAMFSRAVDDFIARSV
jgi:hypothetical protein